MRPSRVLIVDDSALIREVLTEVLSRADGLEVVGTAKDPFKAWEKIKSLRPDVLTLDIEMPRMDGLTFLERLMHVNPMPVVMVSKLTEANCEATFRALELGAVDFVTKPTLDIRHGTLDLADELIEKVRMAASARVASRSASSAPAPPAARAERDAARDAGEDGFIVAVGASSGGVEALRAILSSLPADAPGVVVVQHMPGGFTHSFAQRLDSLCPMAVSEARDGDAVRRGQVLIAPGDRQLELASAQGAPVARVFPGAPVNRHCPSVDVLFESCAQTLGTRAVGVLLSGMGADGARGLLCMRLAGARTLVQDEASCVVFGMPREAIRLGAAEEVAPLDRIPDRILDLSRQVASRA